MAHGRLDAIQELGFVGRSEGRLCQAPPPSLVPAFGVEEPGVVADDTHHMQFDKADVRIIENDGQEYVLAGGYLQIRTSPTAVAP